jgi:hypothetical protein
MRKIIVFISFPILLLNIYYHITWYIRFSKCNNLEERLAAFAEPIFGLDPLTFYLLLIALTAIPLAFFIIRFNGSLFHKIMITVLSIFFAYNVWCIL